MTGALGVGVGSAGAAANYSAGASAFAATLAGGPVTLVYGNRVTRCASSTLVVSGLATSPAALPAAFGGVPAPTFSGCRESVAGLTRPATITTSGTWSIGLASANYGGTLNAPSGGATIAISLCTLAVQASSIAMTLTDGAGAVPALGQPASRLGLNGTVNVTPGSGCPTGTTATLIADGSSAGGVTTGLYELSTTITEN